MRGQFNVAFLFCGRAAGQGCHGGGHPPWLWSRRELMEYGREEVSRRLATVGEIVRDHVLQELRRQSSESLSTIAFETAADKIYVIDRSVETVLLPALVEHLQPAVSFALICEGVND